MRGGGHTPSIGARFIFRTLSINDSTVKTQARRRPLTPPQTNDLLMARLTANAIE
jgi:hypothetical protein